MPESSGDIIILPDVDWIHKKLWIRSNLVREPTAGSKFTISCEFGPLQVKWWWFSNIK